MENNRPIPPRPQLHGYINAAGILLFSVSVAVVLMTCYPYSMWNLESSDFFVWTSDYLRMKLAEKPGFTALVSDFLFQLFRWQGMGAVVVAVVLGLSAWGLVAAQRVACRLAPCGWQLPVGVLLPALVFMYAPFQLQLHLETLFFSWSLWFLLSFRRLWAGLLWLLVASFLMSWIFQMAAWALVVVFAFCYRLRGAGPSAARLLMGVVLSVLMVYALNAWVGFIPFDDRWIPSSVPSQFLVLYILLSVVALVVLPFWGKGRKFPSGHPLGGRWMRIAGILLSAVACCAAVAWVVPVGGDRDLVRQEQVYRLADMAGNKQWREILSAYSSNEVEHNRMTQTYALLAEWMTGALPQRVLDYNVNGSGDLVFQQNARYDCRNFERCLYDCLEMWDAAFYQAYEMGIKCRNGMGFLAMRNMARYAILAGNIPVAHQCLDQLSRSLTYRHWAREWRQVAENAPQRQDIPVHDSLPLRNTRSFTGIYSLGIELQEEYRHDPVNQYVLDGALVAFLLDGQLSHFVELLAASGAYDGKRLPGIYAEAMAMIAAGEPLEQGRQLRERFLYDVRYDLDYRQWRQSSVSGIVEQSSKNSYWEYYARHWQQ